MGEYGFLNLNPLLPLYKKKIVSRVLGFVWQISFWPSLSSTSFLKTLIIVISKKFSKFLNYIIQNIKNTQKKFSFLFSSSSFPISTHHHLRSPLPMPAIPSGAGTGADRGKFFFSLFPLSLFLPPLYVHRKSKTNKRIFNYYTN